MDNLLPYELFFSCHHEFISRGGSSTITTQGYEQIRHMEGQLAVFTTTSNQKICRSKMDLRGVLFKVKGDRPYGPLLKMLSRNHTEK